MERYLTQRYVAVTLYEAQRLAQLDGTPIDQIQHTPDVYLVHRTEWWAWWSDERLTGAISLPDSLCPEGLSTDAVELISEVWESASPPPQCGWKVLADIQRVVLSEQLTTWSSRDVLQKSAVERLVVECRNGQEKVLLRFYQFLKDTYFCNIDLVR
jgi:hypothetical protein